MGERADIPTIVDLSAFDVYRRITEAGSMEDVRALGNDLAAMICARAQDKTPLEKAYRAACAMAATHPDEAARQRWTMTARRYGAWIGATEGETAALIAARSADPCMTFEAARAELTAAPQDPAYEIAAAI